MCIYVYVLVIYTHIYIYTHTRSKRSKITNSVANEGRHMLVSATNKTGAWLKVYLGRLLAGCASSVLVRGDQESYKPSEPRQEEPS